MRTLRSAAALLAVSLALPVAAEGAPAGYLRFPTICADRVAFTAEDDLWWVPLEGGPARRLTSAPGLELMSQWSPDGTRLAYTASFEGNQEVHVIARDGGKPTRLTVHPAQDQVLGWTPSGNVLFRSRRDSVHGEWRAYEVPPTGGRPRQLPVDVAALVGLHRDGEHAAFTRFSLEFRTWKRYTGGWQQDVWFGSMKTGEFRMLTSYPGSDSFPSFWGERILFLSDRDGTGNLWSMRTDGTDLTQHTRHDELDVRWPDVHGDLAVYMQGADLVLTDLRTGTARALAVTLPTDLASSRTSKVDAAEGIAGFDLSVDGTRVAVAARGEIATAPLKEGRTIDLTRNDSAAHQRTPAWSPDGKRVAFLSDAGGEWALWTAPADGTAQPTRLSAPSTSYPFEPAWSPDGKRLAFGSSDLQLVVVDAKSGATRIADTSEHGEIHEYQWSPDGRWLAYAKLVATDTHAVHLWDSGNAATRQVTSTWVNSFSPAWDPKGRYLYLLSDRTVNPLIGAVDFQTVLVEMTRPYALVLRAGEPGPFFPRAEEPEDDEEAEIEEKGGPSAGVGGRGKPKKAAEPVRIDLEGLAERLLPFPVESGNLGGLGATDDEVLWIEQPTRGLAEPDDFGVAQTFRGTLRAFKLEPDEKGKREARTLVEGVGGYDVTSDGRRLLWWGEGGLSWRDGTGGGGEAPEEGDRKVDLSAWHLAVDRRAEWAQIFNEAWRLQREFYWDEGMAGVDWAAARDRHAALLPRVTTREELNDLVGQLLAELSTGHTYVWGGDLDAATPQGIGLLGARLEPDTACDCHRFTKVYPGASWDEHSTSPVTLPQAGVKDGDFLLAINGRRVHADENPLDALVGLDKRLVSLTVSSKANGLDPRTVEVLTTASEERLRYLDWVADRRQRVDRLSGGRVGYLHVPDMGGEGLVEFMSSFFPQLEKEALVVDVRDNGGGFVSQLILERLRRALWAIDRPRHGKAFTYPYRVFTGPMAALCNQSTGSDGDIFAESFQILGLGPVIGTRTWGGVIGIRADKPFVDGGMSTQPEFAWWERRRGWGLENEGVIPDVVLDNDPTLVLKGRDPQLEKAVEMLLERLATARPDPRPGPPPDKSKASFRERSRPYLTRP